MKKILSFFLLLSTSEVLMAQSADIYGKITDAETGLPLPGSTVTIKEANIRILTNVDGSFKIHLLRIGNIKITVTHSGYDEAKFQRILIDNEKLNVNIALTRNIQMGDEVVISASRHPEKITNTPVSIQLINDKALQQFAGSNPLELLSTIQGIHFTRTGINDIIPNIRGSFGANLLQMVDGRNNMAVLSAGLPLMNRSTTIKEDIEKIEIVMGPHTALYGPNALNGLFNTITKDPRKFEGTTLVVSAGNHYQLSARFRHAMKINKKWAYKITGEHTTAREYIFYDSVYAGNQPDALQIGSPPNPQMGRPYGPPVTIPERNVNFNLRNMRGEAHLYYSLNEKSDIILSGGLSNNTWPQMIGTGRNQMIGLIASFLQARLVHPRYFINVYSSWGSMSQSYAISNYTRDYWNRTHSQIPAGQTNGYLTPEEAEVFALRNRSKENNQRLMADGQYNFNIKKAGLFIIVGADFRNDRPNGFGQNLIDSFQKIKITQWGTVIQIEKSLPLQLKFIGALRWDHHSNFGNFTAPKLALTKKIGNGSARIVWAHAYSMPNIQSQYSGIGRTLFGNGRGITYEDAEGNIKTTEPLKPEEINTWELGYKGTLLKKLFIDIDGYYGQSENFISPARAVAGKVILVGNTPVTPANPKTFSTFFNYASVNNYGIDAGLTYNFNKIFSLAFKYSFFDSDIRKGDKKNDANNDGYVSTEESNLNAPNLRYAILVNLQNLFNKNLFLNICTRWVEAYDAYVGSQIGTASGQGSRGKVYGGLNSNGQERYYLKLFDRGPIGGFTTVDITAGYKINAMIQMTAGITNLFNTKRLEAVGSPSIGRLLVLELKTDIPNLKTKK